MIMITAWYVRTVELKRFSHLSTKDNKKEPKQIVKITKDIKNKEQKRRKQNWPKKGMKGKRENDTSLLPN